MYCDYDDVIVDFRSAACRVHKVKPQLVAEYQEPGEWCMTKPIGLAKGLKEGITQYEFWRPIAGAGHQFWSMLKPTPWCKEMLELLEELDSWRFLTAPSQAVTSYSGKIESMRKLMRDPNFDDFHITRHKSDFATPQSVLIDDRDENVQAFKTAGGYGIVFPTRGNCLHRRADDPVSYVRERLEQLRCI